MPSKWAHLKTELPPLPDEPGAYGDALRARVDALRATPAKDLAALFEAADEAKHEAEAVAKAAELEVEAVTRAILAYLDATGMDKFAVGGRTFTPSYEPFPRVDDRATLLSWALDHARGDLLSVHAGKLKSLVKAAVEGEGDLPPGVSVFLKTRLSKPRG